MRSPFLYFTKITSISFLTSLLIGGASINSIVLFSPQVNAQSFRESHSREINIHEKGYLQRKRYKTYDFRGKAQQPVNISVTSREFNTYLEIYNPSGRLIARNDNANGTNSQINLNLPHTGIYTVVVKGATKHDEGRYILRINSESNFQPPRPPRRPNFPEHDVNFQQKNHLFPGETIQHTFQGSRGKAINITVESRQFSPHFTLYDPQGNIITEIDDFHGGKSEIEMKLPNTGIYTVEVRGMRSDAQGEYILTIANR